MIVDTHCHVAETWYEPTEILLHQMDRNKVDRAWLVQLLGVYDNGYQQVCARRHPDRFVSIVGVDWTSPDAVDALERLAETSARGVRLRPGSRSPGGDPLAIWRAAARLRLIVSCVGPATDFASVDFARLIAQFPDLPIVLEHLGGLARPDVGDARRETPGIAGLAAHANVFLKVPGLGQLLPRAALAAPRDIAASPLAAILNAFGADRLMWASDFPVVSTREGYANALAWAREALPVETRDAVLGGAAAALVAHRRDDRAEQDGDRPARFRKDEV